MVCISEIQEKIAQQGAASVVRQALAEARDHEQYGVFLSYTEERALARAEEIDAKMAQGEKVGVLAGVPFALKDNFLAFGAHTTAASRMLESFDAPLQATAVEKLEAEGAICIGKTNLDAFAHGGSTENSAFGPTKNAFNIDHVAGGSSGGSAVATALGIVPFALGTDTGGSIRQPASFNGVVGVKPTYGAVSRYGVVAMASSTDTVGAFATSIDDADLVMSIIAGKDVRDMTTLDTFYEKNQPESPKKIGLIKECMDERVDPEVREAVLSYADSLRKQGHSVEEVSWPMTKHALAIYYIVVPAEISSNLARYDGIRYGHRAVQPVSLAELYGRSRDEGFEIENKRRIMIGSYVLASGYFDAYYLQAQKVRTLLIQEAEALFEEYDALLAPVAPSPAFKIGENNADPVKMYLEDLMTVPASLAGIPAISVPAGETKDHLPIGAQLIGAARSDASLLAIARSVEGK